MDIDLRLPNINAETADGQIRQMKSYMYQLVQQLNWALKSIDSASNGNTDNILFVGEGKPNTQKEAQNTFNSIKSLIIKSADIVNAYYEEMKREYDGEYVAQSDFGAYKETTNSRILENAASIQQMYNHLQSIITDVEKMIETQAWTKSGLLDYDENGAPIYGFEVGQKNTVDGVEVFNKYARFTAGGIYFYLPGIADAVAWMTGTKLFITNAAIQGELIIGGYKIDTSSGIAFQWVGGVA